MLKPHIWFNLASFKSNNASPTRPSMAETFLLTLTKRKLPVYPVNNLPSYSSDCQCSPRRAAYTER